MLRRAAHTIDKMPFAGKYTLQPALKSYVRSGPKSEWLKFGGVNLLLGAFVLAHAKEAQIGGQVLAQHLEHLQSSGDSSDCLYMGIDASYMTAMAAVSLRQLGLMRSVYKIRERKNKRNRERAGTIEQAALEVATDASPAQEESAPESKASIPFTRRKIAAMATAFAVTLGGQTAMAFSYANALNEHDQESCIRYSDHDIFVLKEIPNIQTDEVTSYRDQLAQSCGVSPTDLSLGQN